MTALLSANFVLVAQGSISTPVINHMVFAGGVDRAKIDASPVVAALSKAGYFTFTLYDVTGETHVQVAYYTVEMPEPLVTMRS